MEFKDSFPEEELGKIIPEWPNNCSKLTLETDTESTTENGNERKYEIQEESEAIHS